MIGTRRARRSRPPAQTQAPVPSQQLEGTLLIRGRGTARGQEQEMTHRHRSQLTDLTTALRLTSQLPTRS
jgi:hypothetical protein